MGRKAHISVEPPATYMGAFVLRVHNDVDGVDPGRSVAMDRSAFKALVQKMVEAL